MNLRSILAPHISPADRQYSTRGRCCWSHFEISLANISLFLFRAFHTLSFSIRRMKNAKPTLLKALVLFVALVQKTQNDHTETKNMSQEKMFSKSTVITFFFFILMKTSHTPSPAHLITIFNVHFTYSPHSAVLCFCCGGCFSRAEPERLCRSPVDSAFDWHLSHWQPPVRVGALTHHSNSGGHTQKPWHNCDETSGIVAEVEGQQRRRVGEGGGGRSQVLFVCLFYFRY